MAVDVYTRQAVLSSPPEVVVQDCSFTYSQNVVVCGLFNGFRDKIITKLEIEIAVQLPSGSVTMRPELKFFNPIGAPITSSVGGEPQISSAYYAPWLYDPTKSTVDKKKIRVTVLKAEPSF
jgi:hypothetical protein